jgi:hypothetical protein
MPLWGYLLERLLCASLSIPCFGYALFEPAAYNFLTYWTLLLHVVYFSVDKASPHAAAPVRLLHGMSLVGGIAVFLGYAVLSLVGILHWGSWSEWARQITLTGEIRGAKPVCRMRHSLACLVTSRSRDAPLALVAGNVPRAFHLQAIEKSWEHAWPVIAHVLDCRVNRAELQRCYGRARRLPSTLCAVGSFLAFATCWEQLTVRSSGGDVFAQYAIDPGEIDG